MGRLITRIVYLLARFVPTGLPLLVLRGPLRGRWWIVGAAAGAGKGLSILFNASEPRQAARAAEWARPGSACFDIGANVGFYSLIFARRARVVYAFEPLPRNLHFLVRMTRLNRLGHVRVVPCAMSDVSGIALFAEGRNPAEGALDERGELPVLTTTCDLLVARTSVVPDVIKIDVEGAEMHVLKGAAQTIECHRPDILLSVHSDALRGECLAFLSGMGYDHIEPLDAPTVEEAAEFAVSATRTT